MVTRQVVVNVPEKILLAEKTDEVAFGRELSTLAAVKLYELGRLSSGRAAELGIIVRDAASLERAHAINVIMFDKTGTLTLGRPAVNAFHNGSGLPDERFIALAI